LIVRGDLDVASSINYSVDDWLNVGLAFDDFDEQVTGSHPELINRIGVAFSVDFLGVG